MSTPVMGLVWKSDIGPASKRLVLLALADNASEAGYCWPGIEYLVGKTGLSRASVYRVLSELEDDQLIARRERRRSNGTQRSNVYRINLKLLAERERITSKEERDEAASFEEMFEKPQVKRRVAQRDSVNAEVITGSHHETTRVSPRDDQGLTTRPPQSLTTRPLEPSPEPCTEPSVEPPHARSRAGVDDPPVSDIETARIQRQLQRDRRRSGSLNELAKNPFIPESMPIVARFEQRTNRLSDEARRKWRAAVSQMLDLGHAVEDIEAGMDIALSEGGGWAWLEAKTLVAKRRRTEPAAGIPGRAATTEQHMNQIDALVARRMGRTAEAEAVLVHPREIEAPR